MAEIDDLNTTDASNTDRFPEFQAPSTVNNGARALEGLIARFYQDLNTSQEGTLSGSVIEVTANRTSLTLTGTTSNYRANLLIGWKQGASPNPSPCSLNLDGVGPIALRDNHGNTLSASVIMSGSRCLAVKDGDNDYFRLLYPGRDNFIEANGITAFLDEDDLSTDSDTALASQQSIKAYVDTQVATAGQWEDIASGTISSASEQDISYTSTDYRVVKIYLTDILPQTDDVTLNMRTSTDGGSNFDSGASDYIWSKFQHSPSATFIDSDGSTGASSIVLQTSIGSAAGEGVSFEVTIYDPGTAAKKRILFDGVTSDTSGSPDMLRGHGFRDAAADVDAVRFYFSSGNIASGRYHAVGLKI